MYVSVLLPYVLLTILLIQSARQPGAKEGVIFYLQPDWSRLGDSAVSIYLFLAEAVFV